MVAPRRRAGSDLGLLFFVRQPGTRSIPPGLSVATMETLSPVDGAGRIANSSVSVRSRALGQPAPANRPPGPRPVWHVERIARVLTSVAEVMSHRRVVVRSICADMYAVGGLS